jgi:hypothetical protein
MPTTHFLDDMDDALDDVYGTGDNNTRLVEWMDSEGLNWGALGPHYVGATGVANYGDAQKAFWLAGIGGPAVPENSILDESGTHNLTHDGHFLIWS